MIAAVRTLDEQSRNLGAAAETFLRGLRAA
jgi:hypothetical protein